MLNIGMLVHFLFHVDIHYSAIHFLSDSRIIAIKWGTSYQVTSQEPMLLART